MREKDELAKRKRTSHCVVDGGGEGKGKLCQNAPEVGFVCMLNVRQ